MNDDDQAPLIPELDNSEPDIAHVADRFRQENAPQKSPDDMPKFLGIDPKRLMEITEAACIRIQECRNEMGISFGNPIADVFSVMWDRQTARQMYAGNMNERMRIVRGIFEENNWSYNIPQRIIRMLAAQHSGDLVGSDPFCALMPEKSDDPVQRKLSKQIEKLLQEEIERSNARPILAESIRVALTEGERPHKVTWEVDKTQFLGDAVVMVYPEAAPVAQDDQGQLEPTEVAQDSQPEEEEAPEADGAPKPGDPIQTESGDYIFQKDEFLRFYVDAQGKPLALVKTTPADLDNGTPETTAPQPPQGTASIQLRLKKEPSFILDPAHLDENGAPVFKLVKNLKQTITHHEGLQVAGLFPEDFIYPIRCTSLRDKSCDIMAHCYDMPLASVQAEFAGAGFAEQYLSLRETGPMSQQNEPDWKMGEGRVTDSRKLVNIHETYYRCRVNPDDEEESWLFIVIDYVQRVPVYAEYLGNMKMKRPPFGFLRGVESEPGRAYGVGVYKKFADKNLAIDLWFNRAAMKSSKTGTITFQHENGIKAEYQGQKLTIGSKEIYKIPAAQQETFGPDHPPVFRQQLNEMSDKEFELMEKLIQDGDLCFGVVNTAPEVAHNIGQGTATAVRNVERTGNILQRATEEMMAGDIEELLELMTDTVLENQDEESILWEPGEDEISILSRDEIRNLPRDVRVLLTKVRGEELLSVNQQVDQFIRQYLSFPASIRKKVFPQYRNMLKSLFVADSDEAIEEPTDAELQAEANAKTTTPKEAISLNYKDVPPSIQRQMEAAAGFEPASDDERAQHNAQMHMPKGTPTNISPMPEPTAQTAAEPLAQPPAA